MAEQNTNIVDGFTIANNPTPIIDNQSIQSKNTIDGFTIADTPTVEKPKLNTIDGFTIQSIEPQLNLNHLKHLLMLKK